MKLILDEIAAERVRQDLKWGEQNHPSIDPVLLDRSPERRCEEYEIPGENRAKYLCNLATTRGRVTWGHIATEELSEAISAETEADRRQELIQLAAVIVAWVERIDRSVATSS